MYYMHTGSVDHVLIAVWTATIANQLYYRGKFTVSILESKLFKSSIILSVLSCLVSYSMKMANFPLCFVLEKWKVEHF